MKTYYLISTSSRSANSIQDRSDEIKKYYLSTFDPQDDDKFDRYIDTSESLITEFDANSDQAAKVLFLEYMEEKYDLSNKFNVNDFDDFEESIACMSLGSPPVENELYNCEDIDGVSGGNIYPEANDGVEFLYCMDDGQIVYIDQSAYFSEFMEITEFNEYLENIDPDTENINWSDIDLDSDHMTEIIYILVKNGYTIETVLSPGHLDSISCTGDGEGNIYSYVFIKKQ